LVVRPQLRQLVGDLLGDALPVFRIQPVVRVARRMHIAHRARDLTGGDFENPRAERGVEIALGADLNLVVAALLHEGWQPPDLQLSDDDNEQIGFLQLQDKARLRFDEVRILIPLRDRFDRNLVAADLAPNGRQIFGRRHDVELALRLRTANSREHDGQRREPNDLLHKNLWNLWNLWNR